MDELLKYLAIILFTIFLIYSIPIIIFGFLYSHGAGGSGKIEKYEFISNEKDIKIALKTICTAKGITYKDTTDNTEYKKSLLTIQIGNKNKKVKFFSELQELSDDKLNKVIFYLIYINDKTNDDFGWFSVEKYKNVKLFEKEIIKPLSKKYKYQKLE